MIYVDACETDPKSLKVLWTSLKKQRIRQNNISISLLQYADVADAIYFKKSY